ncbi:MAG: transcription antitermination factor NusB [Bacteroidetes bacterium]|nr:transcription antitermination factor NusB [Bacteroidota bacterium]MCH7770469.1 transcription antitermination factor NusB [Bacteroidota bacterium]
MYKKFKRRIIREKVLQVLFANEMNKGLLKFLMDDILKSISNQPDREFANDLINKILLHADELDDKIKERVKNWEMNRIALIDRILLRMGVCEMLYFPDIPPKVSINESIEIAKEYSTAGSSKFINGILDAILSNEKKSGRIHKQGRGLIEESIIKNRDDK